MVGRRGDRPGRNTKKTVLVVAQDAGLRARLAQALMSAGYAVELAEGWRRAREVVATARVDLGILVADCLDDAGHELAREFADWSGPLIIAAERPDRVGRLLQRTQGCIVTSVDPNEILARATEVLQQTRGNEEGGPFEPEIFAFEEFTLDLPAHALLDANGKEVPLTAAEFAILVTFARSPGRVLSRDQLRASPSGRETEAYDRSIDVIISRLRRKIERDPKGPRLIVTVPGVGYKFVSRPRRVPAPPARQPSAAPVAVAAHAPSAGRPAAVERPAERRQLTVMVCEFVGMAALSRQLDPEDLRTVTGGFHKRCMQIIESCQGRVASHFPDGLIAILGSRGRTSMMPSMRCARDWR
jgi:DNA-binding response OmpR family regulator